MKPLAEQGWAGEGVGGEGCSQKAGYIQGRRWLLAQGGGLSARSELTLSAAGEKGKGARGVPQIKEVWGKKS